MTELSFEEKKQKMITNVIENYLQFEQSLVNQLYMKHDLHGTTIGSERELIWSQLFEMIIPKKFVIEPSVFIIDSNGAVSKEVDFAILDETYTPYIFRYGKIKFVPIEAVAAVMECKSTKLEGDTLKNWADSIEKLKTSKQSVARLATIFSINKPPITQQSTRPIRILCALKDKCDDDIKKYFDFTLLASKQAGAKLGRIDVQCTMNEEEGNLFDWHKSLNFHGINSESETNNSDDKPNNQNEEASAQNALPKVQDVAEGLKKIKLQDYSVKDKKGETISLMTFNFQLNQLLMLINNPILFPHQAYVALFNQYQQEDTE
ncbi:DUF6602 domain-containing protein [Paenibacillus sp. SGZ-1009]|uniref:DUF6602 domain-containing protein n=1 Tax=Paenibacillus campi TaxID=3106031 RepID=UPI002AFF45FE|nr:DUF6602 domain-containing protein [Paenibacillus sp. SGZ-1009]